MSLWAIRFAIAGWIGFAGTVISGQGRHGHWRLARVFWTVGTLLYLTHMITAFAWFHQWSHAAAMEHTAEITARVTGIDWGGGIWFNHGFTLICVLETVVWWMRPQWITGRRRFLNFLIYGYCVFIGFNATVIFAPGWLRWICPGTLAGLTLLQLRIGRQR